MSENAWPWARRGRIDRPSQPSSDSHFTVRATGPWRAVSLVHGTKSLWLGLRLALILDARCAKSSDMQGQPPQPCGGHDLDAEESYYFYIFSNVLRCREYATCV
jgi:hypothetical protein